jgi:uncharacterized membrane protein
VIKRKSLTPDELPPTLHWFRWEAYATWITGIFLFGVVYFLGGGVLLFDRAAPLGTGWALLLSLGLLAVGWLVYDTLWRSPLGEKPVLATAISFALIFVAAFGLTRLYSGRAAFLHLGAMLGTIMAANVWRVIIPGQNQMLADTRAGRPVDTTPGLRAKTRSIHNHYLTLPVLFTMISNHFPTTYGHRWNWLVLVLLVIFGVVVKYVMNYRGKSHPLAVATGAAALISVIAMTARPPEVAVGSELRSAPPVSFASAHAILERRCITCHATTPSNPAFPQPPSGIVFENPRRIQALAPRILVRAVVTKTMPLGNLTGMTDEERDTLGAWIVQGARLDRAEVGAPR